jgi:hypothetical protein
VPVSGIPSSIHGLNNFTKIKEMDRKTISKKSGFRVGIGKSQYKLSALVFTVVLVVGLGMAGYKHFKNKGIESNLATALEQVPSGEIPGWWYSQYFGASVCESELCNRDEDPDQDKLSNHQEYYYSSDPKNRDTNGNGLSDGEDVAFGYAPNKDGKVTFEEAASDESILGESLVFNDEIKDMIVDMTDLNKVVMPEISDAELTISPETSSEAFTDYMLALDKVTKKFQRPDDNFANVQDAVKQQNKAQIDQVILLSKMIEEEIRKIPVPADAVDLHKYQLSSWRNLPMVLNSPDPGSAMGGGQDQQLINKWYDSVQVMIALNQKIGIETQKLRLKYDAK